MQLVQSKSNIIEKVLRDKEGRLVRARFHVYEVAGRIKARLIDFVYIDTKELACKIFSLFGLSSTNVSPTSNVGEKVVVCPFFTFQTLYFSGSKPRAPTI